MAEWAGSVRQETADDEAAPEPGCPELPFTSLLRFPPCRPTLLGGTEEGRTLPGASIEYHEDMASSFRSVVSSLLPSEERLLSRLRELSENDLQSIVDYFSVSMREFDVVIGLPGARELAQALAELRGTPLILATRDEESGWWVMDADAAELTQTAVIVTDHFTDGLPELEIVVQASKLGYLVEAVACAIERTNDRGRSRLELQGLEVGAAVQIADTPTGLVMERRFPQT